MVPSVVPAAAQRAESRDRDQLTVPDRGFAASGTTQIILAAYSRPRHRPSPPDRPKRAARDSGDCRSPRSRAEVQELHESVRRECRKRPRRPARGVSRLAPREPRWTYRHPAAERRGPMLYPPLSGTLTGAPCFGKHKSARPGGSLVTRGRRAGPVRLGPLRSRVRIPRAKPPLPIRTWPRVRTRPSVDRDAVILRPPQRVGKNKYFSAEFPR